MPDFNTIFPHFTERCVDLQRLLAPIAFLLLVGGLISATISGHRSSQSFVHTFGRMIVYIVLLTFLVTWGNTLTQIVDNTVKNVLKVDPTQIQNQYNAALELQKSGQEQKSWWEKVTDFSASIFESLISACLWLLGWFASAIVFYAYIIQKVILYIGYALAPIFIGFLAFGTLRGVGTRYLLNLIGVMVWPLGWGVAGLVTEGLIDFMTDQSFLHDSSVVGGVGYTLQNLIGLGLLGIWIIFSTIAAPVIIQRSLVEGILVGSPLMSGAFAAGKAAVMTAVTTGTTVAAQAMSGGAVNVPLVVAGIGAGAAAGIESLASTSGGLGGGSLINTLAQLRPLGERRGGDHDESFPRGDVTGDKTVAALLQRTKNPYSQG